MAKGMRLAEECGQAFGRHEPPPFITRAGQRIETVVDVVPTLRRGRRAWRDGAYHLYNGHFETWFRSLGRYDLVDAVARIRQGTRDPEVFLNRFLLLVAAGPAPGQVERPWGERIWESIVPTELDTDPELRQSIVYLATGVIVGGSLFLAVLVLSALMGRC